MYTFTELPGAEFNSLKAVLEHAPTAMAIEKAIAAFQADLNSNALLIELQALGFSWDEVGRIIATGCERPKAAYYA